MSQDYKYELHGMIRQDNGKGASRRLRREGWVPAIVYGGEGEPLSIAVKQDELVKNAKHDSFYSQIINLKIDGQDDQEILVRDVQHHVFKPLFQHFDFQRIVRGQELYATVQLHFINEETAPGVKDEGGIISHYLNSVDIVCRPRHLPEYIEVDMGEVEMGTVIHLSDLVMPEGVRLVQEEELEETAVAQVVYPQRAEEDVSEDGIEADDAEDAAEGEDDANENDEA
ncbi:50S ribosomal protein L25/general stress protein Ctc [Suttonella sp. R2A3]|uniref:50S ribosomal protein L25/general stress protein Ctc n=1 Tax=Suttonella sp. R2A3 TaxID=2908648 RepID=UPI001F19CB0F|nr:50S ribosomal protein L25/general stress protein Ctc [Suttonella sp. R2A3]UJF23940.1 50S ribosomal protein L25/general stress protein Ctc [Suttonella sp. R2A3]